MSWVTEMHGGRKRGKCGKETEELAEEKAIWSECPASGSSVWNLESGERLFVK